MKTPLYISIVASGVSLALGVVVLVVGRGNHRLNADNLRLQQELNSRGAPINRYKWIGSDVSPRINQIGGGPPVLLRDVAVASIKNEKIRALLKKHGYTVTVATPTPAPGLPE